MRPVFLAMLLFAAAASLAQETRVLDGRRYTVHQVKAGETLYAIGRHYAVDPDAILKANPAAVAGLSIDQVLLIPQDAIVKKERKTAPRLLADELAHTVRKKETVYGIAKLYGVDQAALLQRNPEIAQGLREGMVVIVPVAKVTGVDQRQLTPAADDQAVLHEVQPGETLYSLGQRYKVKPEEIERANGGLPEGLKAGITVRIPVVHEVEPPRGIAADSLMRDQRFKIAYLLPFSIERNDSLLADPERKDYDDYTRIATQFWAGASLALDTMRARGLNAEVVVFDTGTGPETWGPLWKRPDLRGKDLYIGPFHRSAIEELTRTARDAHIVCPVQQSNKVLLGHPNVSKVVSSRPDQVQQLMRYAAVRHGRDRIIFCRPEIPAEKDLQDQAYRALTEALAQTPSGGDSVAVARPGRRDIGDLQTQLDPARTNVVILASEDVELVAGVIARLAPLTPKYTIRLFGLNSWLGMGTIDPADMDRLNVHLPAETWIDMNDARVIRFVRAYRDRFHTEPDEYAFRGYDVTLFYLSALRQEGLDFPEHFGDVRTETLQLPVGMIRAGPENGWRNQRSVILEVKDMELRRAE